MATLTIKNIPEALVRKLKAQAVRNLSRARRLAGGHAVTWAREAEIQMIGREYSVESHSVLTLETRAVAPEAFIRD